MAYIESVRVQNWGMWLGAGILFMVMGLVLLAAPIATSIASVLAFGILLLVASILHIISALLDKKKGDYFWLHLVAASLTLVVGFLILINPAITLVALTLLIAVFFLSNGLFLVMSSLINRFKGWSWYLFNGLISLLLGILIIMQWPTSSLWVIGLFIGINFVFAGISLVMNSLFIKRGALLS